MRFLVVFFYSLLLTVSLTAAAHAESEPAREAPVAQESVKDTLPADDKSDLKALGKDESVATYERKSISYLRMRNAAGAEPAVFSAVESAVRSNIELPRFDYNDISRFENLSPDETAALVKAYLDKVKIERAREGAEYDVRFKDYVITGDDLRRIANSAYLYRPELQRAKAWKERYVIYRNGLPVVVYRWVANVRVDVAFYSVDFKTGKAQEMTTITGSGSSSETIGSFVAASASRMSALRQAAAEAGAELNKKVRQIEAFNLLTPIRVADWNSVSFGLTKKEGLKLGQGFYVYDYLSGGGREKAGYVRVTRVGDGEKVADSQAQNITVSDGLTFDEGQLLQEYPQLGITVAPFGGIQRYSLNIDPSLGNYGSSQGVKFEVEVAYDLSHRLGLPFVYGVVGGHFMASSDFPEYGLAVGLDKRFYFRRLVLTPGVRLGLLRDHWSFDAAAPQFADWADPYEAENLVGSSLGLTPRIGAELFLTPDWSVGARLGYRLYTPQTSLENADSGTVYDIDGFDYNPSGLEGMLGVFYTF